jgi:hypothetical protein
MYAPMEVRFGSGARIRVVAGVDDYLALLRGLVFQQMVFDGMVPESRREYIDLIEMVRAYDHRMTPRVLISSSPQVAPKWAVARFGKTDGFVGTSDSSERRTIYAEEPVIEVDAQFRAICRGVSEAIP